MSWKQALASLAVLAFLSAFPYGPLFAWSPVHPGYVKVRYSHADVLYPEGVPEDPAYGQLDRYIALAEGFHNLSCSKRITVVACRTWGDCQRFAPFMVAQRPLGLTMATGTVVYLTPRLRGTIDVGGVMRHELSHATLSQNRPLLSALALLKQPWVSEGIAGVVAAQEPPAAGKKLVSLSAGEFVARAGKEELRPLFDAIPQKDWQFSYTAWMYFWEREIELQGKPAYLKFESACISKPDQCRSDFARVYGMELRSAVERYQEDLRAGRFVPKDTQ